MRFSFFAALVAVVTLQVDGRHAPTTEDVEKERLKDIKTRYNHLVHEEKALARESRDQEDKNRELATEVR